MTIFSLKRHSRGLGLSPRRRGAGAVPSYVATAVNFNGSTHLTRGGALTGVSASKVWSGSMWLRLAATSGVFYRAFNATDDKYSLLFFEFDGGRMNLFVKNASGSFILDLQLPCSDTNWHHYMWSFDLANAGNRHSYIDDVSAGTWVTYTDDTMDFSAGDLGWGAFPTGANPFSGDMADSWVRFGGSVIDFSVEANRRMFITAEGKPANPTGWPSGGQVQLYGAADAWHTNKGSGGGFAENGALMVGTGPVQLP
jgi:Concanavalin A-like lectin/glucanases superfamily